jgi:hypothetical protein
VSATTDAACDGVTAPVGGSRGRHVYSMALAEFYDMCQEATKAMSLTEDMPLSQNPNADQWKE